MHRGTLNMSQSSARSARISTAALSSTNSASGSWLGFLETNLMSFMSTSPFLRLITRFPRRSRSRTRIRNCRQPPLSFARSPLSFSSCLSLASICCRRRLSSASSAVSVACRCCRTTSGTRSIVAFTPSKAFCMLSSDSFSSARLSHMIVWFVRTLPWLRNILPWLVETKSFVSFVTSSRRARTCATSALAAPPPPPPSVSNASDFMV
mmetsp:Transcript_3333/g.9460  ORF Transcript_3333/g.9460 Transcript_3333/m.9460 type:complete len:208 (-) Transcript_3333:999-1622(-)